MLSGPVVLLSGAGRLRLVLRRLRRESQELCPHSPPLPYVPGRHRLRLGHPPCARRAGGPGKSRKGRALEWRWGKRGGRWNGGGEKGEGVRKEKRREGREKRRGGETLKY